jgi:Domain of unknown function (DUF4129)
MKRCGVGHKMRSGVFVLAILWAFGLPCRAQAPVGDRSAAAVPSSELNLQSYQRELARIEAASRNPTEIPELRKSLPEAWRVKDGDQIYFVPTKEISEALREARLDPKRSAQLEARLKAMSQQAEALAHASGVASPTRAEGKLKKILDRGEFQEASGPTAWEMMRARVNRWIFEHLVRLLRLFNVSRRTGNAIGWAVLFLAVVTLFYAVYRWLTKTSKALQFRAEVEPTGSDAKHWLQKALAAADRGDFREAIHCGYWASVAHLEDLRTLPRDRARTPRESLRLLEGYPKEQGVLQAITRSFELIWYGYRPVGAEQWAGTKKELEKMGCLQASTAPTVPS